MTFNGSCRNTKGFGAMLLLVAALAAVCSWVSLSWTPLVVSVLALGWLLSLSFLRVQIDEVGLVYRNWFRVHKVSWRDVQSITRSASLPYPANHFYSPSSFKVRAGSHSFVINLLYFPSTFARESAHNAAPHMHRGAGA
jgi:hypothetical protein